MSIKPPSYALILLVAVLPALSAGCAVSGSGLLEPEPRVAVFPLQKRYMDGYADDWGAPRPQRGDHEGTDLFAPSGAPVRSVTAGVVVDGEESDEEGWNTLGGYTVSVRTARDVGPVERGDLFYYAHLRRATSLEPGDEVEAGERLGEVGATGGGPPGTRDADPPHLHLGWYAATERYQQVESGARNPYPLLERLRRSGGSFTVQPEGPFS